MKNQFSEALCALPKYNNSNYSWFPDLDQIEEELNAISVCSQCPIRFECAQSALNNREAWGIWGGMEEFKVRRALGLDSFGHNRVYSKELVCPFCGSTDLNQARKKGAKGYSIDCISCGIHWKSYRLPTKVRRTLKRQYDGFVERSMGGSRKEG